MDSRREGQNVQKHRALEQRVVSKEDAGRAYSVCGPAVAAGDKTGGRHLPGTFRPVEVGAARNLVGNHS